jgi:hypothetical protein
MSDLSRAIDAFLWISRRINLRRCNHQLVAGIGYRVCPVCKQRLDGKIFPKPRAVAIFQFKADDAKGLKKLSGR